MGPVGQPFSTEDFGRFLATIAHSYAAAVYGLDAFMPFLTDAVRGKRPMRLAQYIGKIHPWVPPPPASRNHLHILEENTIRIGERTLLVIRVRLFSVDEYPAYDVIVGEKV